ncbi:transposase [Salmonella enterica subsp. enterica serovar Paratyphi B str. SARA62]|nr:transposase [Salmonella enterica subsp. enterica serovar Paratyphi B str. SARA62]ESF91466.1 putative transposase [Salmonella enterica subsp. enterica serovar Paratyphi B str. ATCC BAA-1585]
MRKARLTEHQNIAVIKLVEAGRAVKDICQEADISGVTDDIYRH